MVETCVLTVGLGVCSIFDLRSRKISLKMIIILFLSGCFFRILDGNFFHWEILGRLLPGMVCFLLSWVSRGAIGLGDACLVLVLGAFMKLEELMVVSMLALFFAGIVALVLLVGFHKKKNDEIPFVPFLLAGFVVMKCLY